MKASFYTILTVIVVALLMVSLFILQVLPIASYVKPGLEREKEKLKVILKEQIWN
jgi:hypothetical protein